MKNKFTEEDIFLQSLGESTEQEKQQFYLFLYNHYKILGQKYFDNTCKYIKKLEEEVGNE